MYPVGMQKEHLELSQADYDYLRAMTTKGQVAARTFTRATALLELHRGQTLRAVAESLHVTRQSVAQWRDRYLAGGLQALGENPRSGRPVRINGKQRARLTALACSTPPEGRARWTLRLLADKAVELGLCESLSHTRARQILKKTNSAPI
jgi:putative transposase